MVTGGQLGPLGIPRDPCKHGVLAGMSRSFTRQRPLVRTQYRPLDVPPGQGRISGDGVGAAWARSRLTDHQQTTGTISGDAGRGVAGGDTPERPVVDECRRDLFDCLAEVAAIIGVELIDLCSNWRGAKGADEVVGVVEHDNHLVAADLHISEASGVQLVL